MRKPDNSAAIKEQRKAREQSAKQFKQQMKMMQRQMKAAMHIEMPEYEAPPPPPTRSTADVEASGREARRMQRRRYGFNQSVSQPGTAALGGNTRL